MSFFGAPSAPAQQQAGFSFGSQTPQTPGSVFGGSSLFGTGSSLFGSSTPSFGTSTPTPAFGSSTPAFGNTTPAFGSTTPAFGSTPPAFGSSTPAFGGSTPAFGSSTPAFTPAFGSSTPAFGSSSPAFGAATPAFGASTPTFGASSTPAFGASSTPAFGPAFGASTPAFGTTFGTFGSTPAFGTTSLPVYGSSTPAFGASTPAFGSSPLGFGSSAPGLFGSSAPALLSGSLPEREIQAIFEAYKEDQGNPRNAFKYLLLSVTDPSQRTKPPGASDIMWAEAMSKLEAMESEDRERLFPELLLGFKDLSRRLQLQDEAIASDTKRLQATEANVKLLQRHFQVDTVSWVQRLRLKEQQLQRTMLKVMKNIEALEGKGLRMPLTKAETHLGEKLRMLVRQLQPTSGELPRRVDSVLSVSRLQAGVSAMPLLPGQLHEQSLADIQEVLRKQTEAISRLASVLKRDMRDIEIMSDDANGRNNGVANHFQN